VSPEFRKQGLVLAAIFGKLIDMDILGVVKDERIHDVFFA